MARPETVCGSFKPWLTILFVLLLCFPALTMMPSRARAATWTDSFPGPALDSRWVQGWNGQNGSDPSPIRIWPGGGIYAYTYTESPDGVYSEDWHGPRIRAELNPFSDFDITARFRCIAEEIQVNRLMVRVLDPLGAQIYSFAWCDDLRTDNNAVITLNGASNEPIGSMYKSEIPYKYSNFYDKDVRLVKSGQDLSFYIEGSLAYSGTSPVSPGAHVEIAFMKFQLADCTYDVELADVFNLVSISVSTTEASVPGQPQNLSGVGGNGFISLSWAPPSNSGNLPITGYKIYRGSAAGSEIYLTTVSGATGFNDTGLTNGQAYYYRVSALNELGESQLCPSVSATPVTVPGPPTSLVGIAGDGYVQLEWNQPANNGGSSITGYNIYRSTDQTPHLISSQGLLTQYNDTGLANGQAYHYWVSALNSVGEGEMSPETVALPGSVASIPSEPRDPAALAGDATVSLTWSTPLNSGNLPILGYRVYRGTNTGSLALLETVTGGLSHSDTGLANGQTYFYHITAFNYLGESQPSDEVQATPVSASLPSAPQNLTLVPGNHTIALSWSNPATDGGSPLLGYRIYRGNQSGGERLLTELGAVNSFTDTGLVNNKTFYYKVAAFTAIGEGPAANASARTPASITNGTDAPEDPDILPDWTDNFTLTSSIATVIALVVGFALAYLFMRGDGNSQSESVSKDADKGVDDKAENDGPDKEEEDK